MALLRRAPALTLALMAAPVAAGLAGLLAPAFGWDAATGAVGPSLGPWRALLDWPGLARAAALSLLVGMGATLAALALAFAVVAAAQGGPAAGWLARALAPLLALPHGAAAFGLAFLIAPSGWIARALSPWATGWDRPPDLLIPGDPWGLALAAGLVLKEAPFLALMTLAALAQADAGRATLAARALGRGRLLGWLLAAGPRVYAQVRLPVYAALAYAMSAVEPALILGPSTPPSLSVQVLLWANDPDLALRGVAAAGALAQTALILTAIGLWRLGERAAWAGVRALATGRLRLSRDGLARGAALGAGAGLAATAALATAGLAVWSVAGPWAFPDLWPSAWTGRPWALASGGLGAAAAETALIGAVATLAALALAVACLEAEVRFGLRATPRAMALLYLPLIAPQVGFLMGLQGLALAAGLDGGRLAVAAAHGVFVTPYVFLSLADPWRAWDARLGLAARALGAGPGRVLWAVRLPMLARPLATAAAVGFAVSAGLYLPTLLIGGGRVVTLTTEAVALAAGGDRRAIGVWALAQAVLPLAAFALALAAGRRR